MPPRPRSTPRRPTSERGPAVGGGSYTIATRAQLAALASPVRQEVVDAVQAQGPCPLADVAALLGRPADALYYHARTLERLGLLVRVGTARAAAGNGRARKGRDAAVYDVPGRPMQLSYRPEDAVNRAGVRRAVNAVLRLAARDFGAALETPGINAHGPERDTWGGRLKGWITRGELREINRCLGRLSDLLGGTPARGRRAAPGKSHQRLMSLAFVLTPIRVRPSRRVAALSTEKRR